MKKNFLFFLSLIILNSSVLAQNWHNINFETGTTTGWNFAQGWCNGSNNPSTNNSVAAPGFYSIVTNTSTIGTQCTNGIDNYGGFPVVAPDGGNYSLLLNNNSGGSKVESVTTNSFIITPAVSNLTFKFAAVLQDAGHSDSTKPYFFIIVRGYKPFAALYTAFYDTTIAISSWQTSAIDSSVSFLPWTSVTIDLKSQISNNYTMYVDFFINDCTDGQHFGYAYVDGTTNNYNIVSQSPICQAGDSTILSGPPGMASYTWSGPKSGNSQNISTNLPGNYTLTTTSFFDFPSPDTLQYQIMVDTIKSSFIASTACSGSSAFFFDQSSGVPNFWQWDFGDLSAISNVQNPTHSYSTPGTYITSLIVSNTCGSNDTTYGSITIYPLPIMPILNPPIYCYAGQNNVLCDTTSTNVSYLWVGPQVGSISSCAQVSDYMNTWPGTYTLTLTDTNNCSKSTYCNVSFFPNPSVSFTLQKDTTQVGVWNAVPAYSSNVTNAKWYWGDGTSTNGLYPNHGYSTPGFYNICVSVYNSCGDTTNICNYDSLYKMANTSSMVSVNVVGSIASVNSIAKNNILSIHPNPTTGQFVIENITNDALVDVFDVNGKHVYSILIKETSKNIDISHLSDGVYTTSIKTSNHVFNKKIILLR